jgi:hypothetical protein
MRSEATKLLETLGGARCPCGHLDQRHRRPDPEFRVGDLVEVRGGCRDCSCRGELRVADDAPRGEQNDD